MDLDKKELYTIVIWPESQYFIGKPHCYLINDEHGYINFGDSAYFVRLDIYENMGADTKFNK
jgi:hypothetical protein